MTRIGRIGLAGASTLVAGVLLANRLMNSANVSIDYLLMLASLSIFICMLSILAALRVDKLTWLVYSYLATPFFANRLLGEVWLGSPDERVAGTVAPFLIGDLVLIFLLVRDKRRLPAWLAIVSATFLLPFFAAFLTGELRVEAFGYQYGVLLRGLLLAWLTKRALTMEGRKVTLDALVFHLGLIFGAMSVAVTTATFFTGSRIGMPGWGTNVFANALCIVGVLCVTTALKRRRASFWILSAACLMGIISSGTRVALLVFLAISVWCILVRYTPRVVRFLVLPTLAGLAVSVFVIAPGVILGVAAQISPRAQTIGGLHIDRSVSLPQLVEAVGRESSVKTRLSLWRASLDMVRAHPITGVGWGQWNWVKASFGIDLDVLLDPHNGFLWLIAEGGVIVTFLVLISTIRLIIVSRRSRLYLALCLLLLLELTNSNVQKSLYAILAGVVIGALLAINSLRLADDKRRRLVAP